MSNVIPLTKRSHEQLPMDLSNTDIEKILTDVRTIEGKWSAKFVRVEYEASWAYVYCYGSTDDCTPVFSITRKGSAYTVVSWHLLDFILNGGFSEYTGDLDSALQFIKLRAEEAVEKTSMISASSPERSRRTRRSPTRGKKQGLAAMPPS